MSEIRKLIAELDESADFWERKSVAYTAKLLARAASALRAAALDGERYR